ncbi:hypothetical protein PENANT_c009G10072 [Penicillium antarcticum]|uniref:Uncharacterized protein n=1 Tax=Penicillium antarcticum TaxID=416450 RepID=A0A1V6Q8S2_9EURO|nr:uncharacterized protein N7508_006343 [Penicillium antarcticum]KAJ5301480.1 hypothetical protein N7508_006343 [Penicillium antarcticum]OQD85624.1 hypothetical protein PENANT_c009G10072 [Penicillium antarcticum]
MEANNADLPGSNRRSSHKRSLSASLLARLSFFTPMEDLQPSMLPTDGASNASTSSRAMSAALAQRRTRRRRGSLRKTALLGPRLESREKRASSSKIASDAFRTNSTSTTSISNLPTSSDPDSLQPCTSLKGQPSTEHGHGPTPYPRASIDDDADADGDESQLSFFRNNNTLKAIRPPITRRRQSVARPAFHGEETATDDEDLISFPRLHSNAITTSGTGNNGPASSPKSAVAGLHISTKPQSSSPDAFYPLAPQAETTYRTVHRPKSSPLASNPVEMKSNGNSADVDWDYSETEWWGWIILIVTWLVFVVGIGSCFEVWSWAWDVGETPYAPPELEDDPTLPIVGYYPALIILTAVMSWVWVVVAWVGMKYFKHANISGDDI